MINDISGTSPPGFAGARTGMHFHECRALGRITVRLRKRLRRDDREDESGKDKLTHRG